METQLKPATYIGSGLIGTDPESVAGPMGEGSNLSPSNTDSGSGSTSSEEGSEARKISSDSVSSLNASPTSIVEALGLLQMRYSDLHSLGARLSIQGSARGKLYIVLECPGFNLGYDHITGDILIGGVPVNDMEPEPREPKKKQKKRKQ